MPRKARIQARAFKGGAVACDDSSVKPAGLVLGLSLAGKAETGELSASASCSPGKNPAVVELDVAPPPAAAASMRLVIPHKRRRPEASSLTDGDDRRGERDEVEARSESRNTAVKLAAETEATVKGHVAMNDPGGSARRPLAPVVCVPPVTLADDADEGISDAIQLLTPVSLEKLLASTSLEEEVDPGTTTIPLLLGSTTQRG